MTEPALSHVFAFTDRREDVAAWYREVLGLRESERHDDSVWFATQDAVLVVHDREDEPADAGFVPWIHVAELGAVHERATARGAALGPLRDGYFFARDPDGRVVGVRAARPTSPTIDTLRQ